jgi:hypothetical protein
MNDEGEEVPDADAPEPSQPLKPVSEDPPVDEAAEEGGGAWDVRSVPISCVPEGEASSMGVAVLRSLRWPGAVTVGFAKKRFASVYVGYGHGAALTSYQPTLPGALPTEYDFSGLTEGQGVAEKEDVTQDPDEGKVAEGEAGADEEQDE